MHKDRFSYSLLPKEATLADEISRKVPAEADRVSVERNPDELKRARNATHDLKINKIPKDLRKVRPDFSTEKNPFRRILWRMKRDSQFSRSVVQVSFLLLCIWIGIEFYLFVQWGITGGAEEFYPRPPGVEGFLPISALMSLKLWLQTGIINEIHPSGIFILLAISATGLLLKKSFCSWLCPIGTLSESLWMFGKKIFGRNLKISRWIDYPLRSLKYLLLLFFLHAIWNMDVNALKTFIYSPYNRMADVKMYLFFANISSFALWTILILGVLSIIVENFWCRYLCPYGALLGSLSWLSPFKITRNKEACIDCELCTKACPSSIKVHKVTRVWSDECMACFSCIEKCPVKNTLEMKTRSSVKPVSSGVFTLLVVGVFVAITGLAMLIGHWENGINKDEYLRRFKEVNSPLYDHAKGQVPSYGPND